MLALNVALALAPSLLLLWWAYRRDSLRKESLRLLGWAFLVGLLAVVPAFVVGFLAGPFHRVLRGPTRLLYQAFIVAALVEEGVKYVVLTGFVRRHEQFDRATDGIVYGMAASLGFAFLENVLFVGGPSSALLLRGITAVPLHAGCGAIMGYFVGRAHFDSRRRAGAGLLVAILVHGAYDAFVLAGGALAYASLAVVAGLIVAVPLLFRRARAEDVASGRVRMIRNGS